MSHKYILYVYLFISIIAVTYLTYLNKSSQVSLSNELEKSYADLAKSKLTLGRAQLTIIDSTRSITYLEKGIESEVNKRGLLLKKYGSLLLKYEHSSKGKRKAKVITTPGPSLLSKLNLQQGLLYQATGVHSLIPIKELSSFFKDDLIEITTKVISFPNYDNEITINSLYTLNLSFSGELVEALTPLGAPINYFNLWRISKDGTKQEKIELKSFTIKALPFSKARFFLKALRIDAGAVALSSSLVTFHSGASIGLSFIGYGSSITDLNFRALRLSLDFLDTSIAIGFTPLLYNLANNLPLVTNMWIGPHINYGKKISAGVILNAVF